MQRAAMVYCDVLAIAPPCEVFQPSMDPNDSREFRSALACFATGVTIVSTLAADGGPIGLTVNSFSSVSLRPPLILWCLGRDTPRFDDYLSCSHYAINVLTAEQTRLAELFASREIDKFAGMDYLPGLGGAPLLAGCHAWFQCANRRRYEGGDHLIFVGEVLACERREATPLLFAGGRFRSLAPCRY